MVLTRGHLFLAKKCQKVYSQASDGEMSFEFIVRVAF